MEIFKRPQQPGSPPRGQQQQGPSRHHRGGAMSYGHGGVINSPPMSPPSAAPGGGHAARVALRGLGGAGHGDDNMVDNMVGKRLVSGLDSNLLVTSSDYGVHVVVQQAKHLPKVRHL